MEEMEARLALLKYELEALQTSIRAFDTILFQIKGWCVTATFAVAGFTVTSNRPALLFVGVAATIGFWLVDALYKSTQRVFILRNRDLEQGICASSVVSTLTDDELRGPKIAMAFSRRQFAGSRGPRVVQKLGVVLTEAFAPLTFGLYLFIVASLGVEGLLLM